MTILEDLVAIRALVAKGWTQKVNYRNERDEVVSSKGPICKVCLHGAICLVTWTEGVLDERQCDVEKILEAFLRRKGFKNSYIGYNDTVGRTQEEILALLDEAIASHATKT